MTFESGKLMKTLCGVTLMLVGTSCVHPMIRYQKGRLLDPMMDPAKTEGFERSFRAEVTRWNERGALDQGGAVGGSCPTCGG